MGKKINTSINSVLNSVFELDGAADAYRKNLEELSELTAKLNCDASSADTSKIIADALAELGVRDSSSSDTLSKDASSSDASLTDTSSSDASSSDASLTDSSSSDTLSKDSSSSDTLSKDASSSDASSSDTSSADTSFQSTPATSAAAEEATASSSESVPEKSLDELLEELHSLIGLEDVKKEVEQIINVIKVQKKAEEFGETAPPLSLHLVFYGNPGTGKTTVARLLAQIYKSLGVLSKGQLVEVDRSGLVAGYVGQTATKTQNVIQSALGGILFIDEAYALVHGKGETDYGQEAIETLLKAMEDNRDDFIVIVAGYTELMKEFVASNPGLKSRFNQFISFADYTPEELKGIFDLQCSKNHITLGEGCDDYLMSHFQDMYDNRGDDYANGRDVRNYFENAVKAKANRLGPNIDEASREDLMTITLEDLKAAAEMKKDI